MTAIEKTTEQLDLTEFEFDIPCDIEWRHRDRTCPEPAAWLVLARRHGCNEATRGGTLTHAFCEPHFRELMSGAWWLCALCDTQIHARLFVVRTERIR